MTTPLGDLFSPPSPLICPLSLTMRLIQGKESTIQIGPCAHFFGAAAASSLGTGRAARRGAEALLRRFPHVARGRHAHGDEFFRSSRMQREGGVEIGLGG